jgi:hypothetical protein
MLTSAVGFGEHYFLGVDKSQCPPYEKSLIVVKYCWQAYFKSIGTLSQTFKNHIHNNL